jgi:hypothetical protein
MGELVEEDACKAREALDELLAMLRLTYWRMRR